MVLWLAGIVGVLVVVGVTGLYVLAARSRSLEPEHSGLVVEHFRLSPGADLAQVIAALAGYQGLTLVEEEGGYLRYEARTPLFGFVDDVELHVRQEEGIVAVRSTSRVGHSDMGTNRRRVEEIRAHLRERGVVNAAGE
jgi:uncharacterized protein (DUF1499 family)